MRKEHANVKCIKLHMYKKYLVKHRSTSASCILGYVYIQFTTQKTLNLHDDDSIVVVKAIKNVLVYITRRCTFLWLLGALKYDWNAICNCDGREMWFVNLIKSAKNKCKATKCNIIR